MSPTAGVSEVGTSGALDVVFLELVLALLLTSRASLVE